MGNLTKDIVLLDLFSGIGGFSLGLSQAGFNITTHYYSEIDKHAIANYKYNFKNSIYVGSVTDLDGRTITRPNIITFGSPCQDFSVAGKRAGMDGQRSSLIGQALRLIAECRPDVFIWENVKGVFSSNAGEDFWAIIQAFTNIGGYRLEWQLLNTAWFLPQNRERIFLIGHFGEGSRQLLFPFGGDIRKDDGDTKPNETTSVRTLSGGGHSGGNHSSMTLVGHRSDQPYKLADCSPTIRNSDKAEIRIVGNVGNGHEVHNVYDEGGVAPTFRSNHGSITLVAQRGRGENNEQQLEPRKDDVTNSLTGVQKDNKIMIEPTHKHGDYREYKLTAPTIQSRYGTGGDNVPYIVTHYGHKDKDPVESEISPTLKANSHGHEPMTVSNAVTPDAYLARGERNRDENGKAVLTSMHERRIRRLTEVECERLQGFPDNWTEYGDYDGVVKKIAKTQRYKMLGNAITVRVMYEIGIRLLKTL